MEREITVMLTPKPVSYTIPASAVARSFLTLMHVLYGLTPEYNINNKGRLIVSKVDVGKATKEQKKVLEIIKFAAKLAKELEKKG